MELANEPQIVLEIMEEGSGCKSLGDDRSQAYG